MAERSLYVGFPDHPGLTWTNEGVMSSAGAARWRLLVLNAATITIDD